MVNINSYYKFQPTEVTVGQLLKKHRDIYSSPLVVDRLGQNIIYYRIYINHNNFWLSISSGTKVETRKAHTRNSTCKRRRKASIENAFFMNISHELKTPLTLITLAAERMAELNLSKECMTILSNSQRMLSLITELVDIRKQI